MARLNLDANHPAVLGLSKCKVKTMLKKDCAFFAALILQTPVYWITADEIPTAATDGINLFFNPDFFVSLDPEERIFLLLHEVMHNVYNHGIRRGFRDHKMWNKAGDYVINDELIRRGFKMPEKGLHDLSYRDMSADAVYAELMKNQNDGNGSGPSNPWPDLMPPPQGQQGQGQGQPDPNGNGNGQVPLNPAGNPAPTAQEIEDHTKNLLSQATQAAQMKNDGSYGNIPGNVTRDFEEMMHPKLPWFKILSRFLFSLNKNDYSWRKPNRRFISQGIIMPSLHSEGIGKVAFAIDTSGSVSTEDFNTFCSEIGYVFKHLKPKEIDVLQFDHILQGNDRIMTPSDFLKLEFKGGGGTRIEPVIEAYKNSDAKALVILTDGYLHQDVSMDPAKPVVWCIYDNPKFVPTFGTAIHFDKD